MFYAEKFVPEILHHVQKTELKLVEALSRKSQNTLSVSKQTSKLVYVAITLRVVIFTPTSKGELCSPVDTDPKASYTRR